MMWWALFTVIAPDVEGHLNTLFVRNGGQIEGNVLFHSLYPFGVAITGDGRILFYGVSLSFGSEPSSVIGDLRAPTTFSYFAEGKSLSDLPTYRRVILKEVYPRTNAVLTGDKGGRLELQFVIEPGGDPEEVRLEVEGGRLVARRDGIHVLRDGVSILKIGNLRAYQGAEEVDVEARVDGNVLRFRVGDYDPSATLVIDPILTLTLGSSGRDEAMALAMDSSGNVIVVGSVGDLSSFVPTDYTFGPVSTGDVFVSKFSPGLGTLIATAVVGGSGYDEATDVAVGPDGSIFITGLTDLSDDFAPDRVIFGDTSGSNYDVFITRLSPDLSQHLGTAILASANDERAAGLVFDSLGNVIVAGWTLSASSFVPYDTVFGELGYYDVFITKLDRTLTTHITTVMVGSSDRDRLFAIDVGEDGSVYLAGETDDSEAFSSDRVIFGTAGLEDVFVTRLSSDLHTHLGTAVVASWGFDEAHALTVGDGKVVVAGWTDVGSSFSVSRNVLGTPGNTDVFVTALTPDLSTHLSTTIVASPDEDKAHAVAVRGNGEVLVAGWTFASDTFSTDREIVGTPGLSDAFLTVLDSTLNTHVLTVILASDSLDGAEALLPVGWRDVLVAGWTRGALTFATADTALGTPGGLDAFLTLLSVPLSVSERGRTDISVPVEVVGNTLRINLSHSAYVGYDVYSVSGRLVRRMSLGYLPAGRYEYRLDLRRGTYILKVRVGERIREMKVVM